MPFVDDYKKARRISTPLLAIHTADQEETIKTLMGLAKPETYLFTYDVARGLVGHTEEAVLYLREIFEGDLQVGKDLAGDPGQAMILCGKLPPESVLFFSNAQRHLNDATVAQAIACMRDQFKMHHSSLVLLGPQLTLPAEITGDVMVLDDPLPTTEQISSLLDVAYSYVGDKVPAPDPQTRRQAVEAVRGLHAAAIDQAFAFAMEPVGINVPLCWEQKRSRVEQTRGLTFYTGTEKYSDIGGLAAFKDFMQELHEGPEPFNLIVWLDEMEKTMTGSTGYSGDGGVSADQLGCTLTAMEDNGWTGAIAVGPTGAGKSFIAKASGTNFGVPCIRMDLKAMKAGIVGESEQLIRQVMKVLYAIAGSNAFFIATCNNMTALPPELVRRFSLGGTWFFDLPDAEEKGSIWEMNCRRFHLEGQEIPNDNNWTGSDIRNCCQGAYRRRRTLIEVARQIIPFAQRDPGQLAQLRQTANGAYLSASHTGAYLYKGAETTTPKVTLPSPPTGRKLEFN